MSAKAHLTRKLSFKKYCSQTINRPIDRPLADSFSLTVRSNIAALQSAKNSQAFDNLANCIDLMGMALAFHPELLGYFRIVQSGALALCAVKKRYERLGRIEITQLEWLPIFNAATAIEHSLIKLDTNTMTEAKKALEQK